MHENVRENHGALLMRRGAAALATLLPSFEDMMTTALI
jgi:hypothetical protein